MRLNQKHRTLVRIILTVIGMALAYFAHDQYNSSNRNGSQAHNQSHHTQGQVGVPKVASSANHSDESSRLVQAHARKQSKVWMTVKLKVFKILPDDNEGSRHQKFLAKPAKGPTLKVVHNIDLAPKVPVRKGAVIWVRGRYEWSAKGGVLHWTHHDPRKPNRQDPKEGWIELNGKRYD